MASVQINKDWDDPAIATWIGERLDRALAASRAPVAITVPGGSSPYPIMEQIARGERDWSRVTVWPGDDRLVPEDHAASNTGRIRAIFEPVGARVATLSLMEQVPHFAIAWLGMGEDGHVASLFPSSDPRADDAQSIRRVMPDPLPPEAPFERITLTIPALVDSDVLFIVARGAGKRAILESAARGEDDTPVARLIAAARREVTCFV